MPKPKKDKNEPELGYYEPWVIEKYKEYKAKLKLEGDDGNKDNNTSG